MKENVSVMQDAVKANRKSFSMSNNKINIRVKDRCISEDEKQAKLDQIFKKRQELKQINQKFKFGNKSNFSSQKKVEKRQENFEESQIKRSYLNIKEISQIHQFKNKMVRINMRKNY